MSKDSVFSPGESLTIAHAAATREALLQALDLGATGLDLSGVNEIDTSGVQLLIAARQHSLQFSGTELALTNPSACVAELLQRYGLEDLLPGRGAHATKEDAHVG